MENIGLFVLQIRKLFKVNWAQLYEDKLQISHVSVSSVINN